MKLEKKLNYFQLHHKKEYKNSIKHKCQPKQHCRQRPQQGGSTRQALLALFVGVMGGEESLGAQPTLGATKPGLWAKRTAPWFLDPTPML